MAEENKEEKKIEFDSIDIETPYDDEIRTKYLEAQLADATNNDTRLVELQLEIMAIQHYRNIYIKLYNDKLKNG